MSTNNKSARPEARIAKGFRDCEAAELKGLDEMLRVIRGVYERYGFDALETPAIEYTEALGKFLPDQDRPNAGVFSFQDEDEQWMSLRYDLTAPLARYVAQNYRTLPKPFRRYAYGPVWRNEKPGPGRFRQFLQFDADTVGSDSIAADAEMCMLAADALEALGVKRGDYVIKVNSRKVLDGLISAVSLSSANPVPPNKLTILRAIDKLDRLTAGDVARLLGPGRMDESGDLTPGAGLDDEQIGLILTYLSGGRKTDVEFEDREMVRERPLVTVSTFDPEGIPFNYYGNDERLNQLSKVLPANQLYLEGLQELAQIARACAASGYEDDRVEINPSCVRGLEYYTGPVFEAELTFEVKGDDGRPVRFGSVGGGGRYDDLVARFTGERVPATGFSIGVSRLQAALAQLGAKPAAATGPVVVLVLDKDNIADYQRMTQTLRNAGVRAEMYLGASGMKAQMKYADKRNAPCVVIQGSDERAKGEVTLKDLIEGAKAADAIKDNKEWKAARPAQVAVREADLVDEVKKILARHQD